MEIAKTIQQQLLGLGKIKVWSWGANSWTAIKNGLAFKVQGFKFKGVVQITLNSMDLYDIEFIKAGKVKHTANGIYFDQMVDIIDNFVEYTGADYDKRVMEAKYKI